MSRSKTNPRNIPRSQADCDREYQRGLDDGMTHMMEMVLFCLADKHGASHEDIHTLAGEIDYLADSIRRGDIKWKDIFCVLYDEFDLEVKFH